MEPKYTDDQLNNAYQSLTPEQRLFLDEHVRRGKKTEWLNTWAKKLGAVLSEEEKQNPEASMERLLEWILIDYEEGLTVSPERRCECGRALKRRYTIQHKTSGTIYRLGIVHFEEHTGLPPDLVRLIQNGLKKIDLERTEILTKVLDGWTMQVPIIDGMKLNDNDRMHLGSGLPLLERQLKRIRSEWSRVVDENRKKNEQEYMERTKLAEEKRKAEFNRQREQDRIEGEERWKQEHERIRQKNLEYKKKTEDSWRIQQERKAAGAQAFRTDFSRIPQGEYLPLEFLDRRQFVELSRKLMHRRIEFDELRLVAAFIFHMPDIIERKGMRLDELQRAAKKMMESSTNQDINLWLDRICALRIDISSH